jgi:hypothetical protein
MGLKLSPRYIKQEDIQNFQEYIENLSFDDTEEFYLSEDEIKLIIDEASNGLYVY